MALWNLGGVHTQTTSSIMFYLVISTATEHDISQKQFPGCGDCWVFAILNLKKITLNQKLVS